MEEQGKRSNCEDDDWVPPSRTGFHLR